MTTDWLEVQRGDAPLIISFPHTGTAIPDGIASRMISTWRASKDTDWWIHRLYDFGHALGATTIRTSMSRSVIDVNRDPNGLSLYPGQPTTELCPTRTFDGEPLYIAGEPDALEIRDRRTQYFEPYHDTLAAEITRLRARYDRIVLYEAHSIRSRISRLFDGLLPNFNIGTNEGASCDAALTARIEAICDRSAFTRVTNGRFKGGWTTRHYGRPAEGVAAVQMELACRGYLDEPDEELTNANWPPLWQPARAAPMRAVLSEILHACISFALSHTQRAS